MTYKEQGLVCRLWGQNERPVSLWVVGCSVLVRSRLSMSVQPPIANFPDNPVYMKEQQEYWSAYI